MNTKRFFITFTLPVFTGCMIITGCTAKNNPDVPETVAAGSTAVLNEKNTVSAIPAEAAFFAMDTFMTLTAYGENAAAVVQEGESLVNDIENRLSTEIETSAVSKLNKEKTAVLDDDTAHLLEQAMEAWQLTDGAFNISLYPLLKEWGFISQNYKVPSADTINDILENTDLSEISFDKKTNEIEFENKAMEIDLGGIAKGYTSDALIKLFKDKGIASGMVNLGGNVQLLGTKPDGSLWRVGISSPYENTDFIGILTASDVAVITSGGYERNFKQDGRYYHHIMDPATGYPADKGLISVTVISKDAIMADALSTALYVMGRDKALDFWKSHSNDFETILMDDTDMLYVTEGISESFTSDTFSTTVVRK